MMLDAVAGELGSLKPAPRFLGRNWAGLHECHVGGEGDEKQSTLVETLDYDVAPPCPFMVNFAGASNSHELSRSKCDDRARPPKRHGCLPSKWRS